MSTLTVVYGGQWGSEGKGQVCAFLAENTNENRPIYAVRVGGPNAGHTVVDRLGKVRKLQQIPVAAFVRRNVVPVIGCSGLLHLSILERELEWLVETWGEDSAPPVVVDRGCIPILPWHQERETGLTKKISSTGEGVGAATADKVMRVAMPISDISTSNPDIKRLIEAGRIRLEDTVRLLNSEVEHPDRPLFLLEGTQGYLLGLHTSGYYPYCTSRECGPEGILSQVGLSPRSFEERAIDIIGVFRTYPIRVGGPSGPLPGEISWEDLEKRTGGYVDTPERTTVTDKVRRIARLDRGLLQRAVWETRPTEMAVTFFDYLFPELAHTSDSRAFLDNERAHKWLYDLYSDSGVYPSILSTGPGQEYTFWSQMIPF